MRVVSLLPSATEIICLLAGGAESAIELVGRSHECDFPEQAPGGGLLRAVRVLTAARTAFESAAQIDRVVREELAAGRSLYTLNTGLLKDLRPDLIVTQDLCEVCSIDLATVRAAAADMQPRPEIVSLNPATFEGMLDDVLTVGRAMGVEAAARETVVGLRERMDRAAEHVNPYAPRTRVAFLEWTEPLFCGGHWTPQLIERAGGEHTLNPTSVGPGGGAGMGVTGQTLRVAGKSVRISPEALAESRPDRIIVCPCGLGLDETRREVARLSANGWWRELPAVRAGRVALVDGNQYFNRPGPRLVDAFEFLVGWMQGRPELIPAGFAWEPWRG